MEAVRFISKYYNILKDMIKWYKESVEEEDAKSAKSDEIRAAFKAR